MSQNESGRGWVGDAGEVVLVLVGRGEGLANRIKNYLFFKM